MYQTIVLPVVLCGRKTCFVILREERGLRVFENRVLRGIFGSERDEVTGSGENYTLRSLMIGTAHPLLFGLPNQQE
jgi:hypothetical protein